MKTHEGAFGTDFEENKLKVSEFTDIKNKTIRNRVAGYVTRVLRHKTTRRGEVELDV
jgi:small subunit ribosomal protein S17e